MRLFALIYVLIFPCLSWAIEDAREVTSDEAIAKSSVQLLFKHNGRYETCSGTLISETQILTAGHCIEWYFSKSKDAVAIFGTTKYLNPSDAPAKLKRSVRPNSKLHPKYKKNADADQALLKITGEIPVGFSPIKVVRAATVRKLNLSLIAFYSHGFGPAKCNGGKRETKKLRKKALIDLEVVRNEKKSWMALSASAVLCQGDSGGAVIAEMENENFLIAINVSGDDQSAEFVTVDLDAFN